jgi:hypothetical protein
MFLLEIYFNFREIYFGIIFSLLIILGGIILYKFGFDEEITKYLFGSSLYFSSFHCLKY